MTKRNRPPVSYCPYCLQEFRLLLTQDQKVWPRPGELSVCLHCAAVIEFGPDLKVVPPESGDVERAYREHPGLRQGVIDLQRAVSARRPIQVH